MMMNEFVTEPKDLLTITAVSTTNYLVFQTSYSRWKPRKVRKRITFVCKLDPPLCTKRLRDGYNLAFARGSVGSSVVLYVKVLAVAANINKHATPNDT